MLDISYAMYARNPDYYFSYKQHDIFLHEFVITSLLLTLNCNDIFIHIKMCMSSLLYLDLSHNGIDKIRQNYL